MLLDCLPFVILAIHFCDKGCLAMGKLLPVYCLTISGSISTIAYNFLLWSDMKGNHSSILLFSVSSLWTVAMSIMGLMRLVREHKTKSKQLILAYAK